MNANSMIRFKTARFIFTSLVFFLALDRPAIADIGASEQVALEMQLQQRVLTIVSKVDKQAIVQVHVTVKKISSALPGVWTDASQVTPVTSAGTLAMDGIESVQVRIVSQEAEIPDWIKDEVKRSLELGNVTTDIKYEKAKGIVTEGAVKNETADSIKTVGKELVEGIAKTANGESGKQVTSALWGLVVGLIATMLLLCGAIFILGRKIEGAFFRVVDEKLAPLMATQSSVSSRNERMKDVGPGADAKNKSASLLERGGHSAGNDFKDLSDASIFALMIDCYWTQSDAYAHYVWTELCAKQRDALLANKKFGHEFFRYLQFARQFTPEALTYHQDVQYVEATDNFSDVDQADLAAYVSKNPSQAARLTPMRWEMLPISLADRLQATLSMNSSEKEPRALEAVPTLKSSARRSLPRKLDVKTLNLDDEKFLFENPHLVAANLRASLKTLVWIALCEKPLREEALEEINARDLAEIWIAPEGVLAKLKESIPEKKFEMIEFYLKTTTPDRESPMFDYLVQMGADHLSLPTEMPKAKSNTEPKAVRKAQVA